MVDFMIYSPMRDCFKQMMQSGFWHPKTVSNLQFGYRDFSADDVLTTANAVEQSRLQALSVACGRVRVPEAYTKISLSVVSCQQEIDLQDNSTECQQAAQLAADNGKLCNFDMGTTCPCNMRFC